jgi:signal transduction histidine kinase
VAVQGSNPAQGWAVTVRAAILVMFRPVVAPRTWLAVVHLLAGAVIGLAAFLVVVVATAVGVALSIILIGLPLLALMLWFCWLLGHAERARFRLLLGADIPAPPAGRTGEDSGGSRWRRGWRALAAAATYKRFGYALARFPLSMVQGGILTAVWSMAFVLLTLPAYNFALPRGGAHLGTLVARGPAAETGGLLLGLALLAVAPRVTMALAAVDVAISGWLLGAQGRADLTARIGELERSRAGVVSSAEAERRRIERDLHDGAQQRLVALAMELGRAKAKFATDPQAAQTIVGQAHEEAKAALAELRNLVRGMHPPVLSDRGLDAALSGLATISPVPVSVNVELASRAPAQVEAIAYFVAAEALTNVAKHARASHAEIRVDRHGDVLRMLVRDDGVGGANPAGQGLTGLADRVSAVDGRLAVSSPAGGPTLIEVELPCGS